MTNNQSLSLMGVIGILHSDGCTGKMECQRWQEQDRRVNSWTETWYWAAAWSQKYTHSCPQVVEAHSGISCLPPLQLLLFLTLKFAWVRDVCVDQGWMMLMECCSIFSIEWQAAYESSAGTEGGLPSPSVSFPLWQGSPGLVIHEACIAKALFLVLSWEL